MTPAKKTCGLSDTEYCLEMLQIENEYGFCGFNDKDYLQNLVDITQCISGQGGNSCSPQTLRM